MKKIAFYLMILTAFSKIFGFLRDLTLSYFYGASNISDAYLISITIPSIIFIFISTGITTGYIPIQSKLISTKGKEEGDRFTSNLLNVVLIISFVIAATTFLFTEEIVKAFASGFDRETLNIAVLFTKISITGIFFTGVVYVFSGYLQLNKNFIAPALISLPQNLIIILAIILSKKTDIIVLSIGVVVAAASQLLLLLPFIKKENFKFTKKINFKDKYLIKLERIAVPAILGISVNQINSLVDRTLASNLAVGGISSLNYISKLITFIIAIVVTSIVTVLYPMISKMVAENNIKGLKKTIIEALGVINLLTIPAMVGAMFFAEPIVTLLFKRGAFDEKAVMMTSGALFFYAIGLLGFGSNDVLTRTFYSLQDTKTPMKLSALSMVLNIILNLILSRFMGINGLALATSISAIVYSFFLFIGLRKKIGGFGIKKFLGIVLKIMSASLIMGTIAKLFFYFIMSRLGSNLSLLISITLGAVIYFILIYAMKIEGVDTYINSAIRKIKKSKNRK